MSVRNNYTMINIREYLALGTDEEVGEPALVRLLSDFSCPKNPDVRTILLDGLAKIDGIRCNRPNGAFYVFADISSFGLSSVEFCNRLLDEQKVVCIPGSAFGECGEGFIRIAYTCSDDNLYEALNRISCFCKKLMK